MSILFGLLLARRFYCRSALSLSPGRTGGLLPRINAPIKKSRKALTLPDFYNMKVETNSDTKCIPLG